MFSKYKKKDLVKLCSEYESMIDIMNEELNLLKTQIENKEPEIRYIEKFIEKDEKPLTKKEKFFMKKLKYIEKRFNITKNEIYKNELKRIK